MFLPTSVLLFNYGLRIAHNEVRRIGNELLVERMKEPFVVSHKTEVLFLWPKNAEKLFSMWI